MTTMETIHGGSAACEITVGALFSFGGGACVIPGLQIIGGVTVGIALVLYATKGCG